MNKVYDSFFNEPKPVRALLAPSSAWDDLRGEKASLTDWLQPQCRTCVAVHELPMRTDVEIECVAHL